MCRDCQSDASLNPVRCCTGQGVIQSLNYMEGLYNHERIIVHYQSNVSKMPEIQFTCAKVQLSYSHL